MKKEEKTLMTSFKVRSNPHKVAKGLHRKMLRDGFNEALVEVPGTEDTILIPASAPVEAIEECIKNEQKKAVVALKA